MDSGPGVSLFQGSEDIQLNSSLQRQEEEEAIEDDRRRNEEIKNLLTNAFDDLSMDDDEDDDDDRTTINSSSFHSNGNGCEVNKSSMCDDEQYNYSNNNAQKGYNDYSSSDTAHRTDNSNVILTSNNKDKPSLRSILKNSVNNYSNDRFNESNKNNMQHDSFKKPRHPFTLPSVNNPDMSEVASSPGLLRPGIGDGGKNENRSSSPHHLHCYRKTSIDGKSDQSEFTRSVDDKTTKTEREQREAYMTTRYNSVEQLQLLYDVRLKEIESLKDQLEKERTNSKALKDDLTHKMMLAEAEKEGAILSYTQSSELLAWSKGKISDLEREVATLKQNIVNLEKSRSENIKELETARGMITDLQQKLAFLERSDGTKQTERQLENTIKSLQNKHLQEITQLNHQLDNNNSKLKQKNDDIKSLEERLLDLQGKLGSLMVEKSDTVTALMRDLEESQSQCRQLMASNISCDNVRLQQKLDDLLKEREDNNKTVVSLRAECDMLRTDLEQLESVSRLGLSPVGESDSMVQLGLTSKSGSSGNTTTQRCDSNLYLSDTNNKLKDELHRALLGQRAKRSEIKRLQEKLNRRETDISDMKKQERIYLAEVESLKEDMGKLMSELKSRRTNSVKADVKDACIQTVKELIETELENERKRITEIENEKEKLKHQLTASERLLKDATEKLTLIDNEKSNDDVEKEVLEMVRNQFEAKEIEYRVILEQKNKECDELKELYIQLRASKDAVCKQLDSVNDINCNNNTQIKTLKSEINDCKSKIKMKDELLSKYKTDKETLETELNKWKSKELQDEIISEKEKENARLKEELRSASKQYSTELNKLRNELQIAKDRVIQLEKKLRSEFTNEISKNQTEINFLRSVIQEKETQLKEMAKKLHNYTDIIKNDKNVMTDNDMDMILQKENEQKLLQVIEKHSKELKKCEENAARKINSMEKIHKGALDELLSKKREEIIEIEEKYYKIISTLKKHLVEQEESLKAKYAADLALAEEEVKDITVKYFAEEIKKMETRHRNELEMVARRSNSSPIENLQKILAEKDIEIEKLRYFKTKYLEAEEKITELVKQMDMDRNSTAELMTRWAKEVQDLHSQLKTKQEKLKNAKQAAIHFRKELRTFKQNAGLVVKKQQYQLLQELQDKIQKAFESGEKSNEIQEVEEKYSAKERALRRKLKL